MNKRSAYLLLLLTGCFLPGAIVQQSTLDSLLHILKPGRLTIS